MGSMLAGQHTHIGLQGGLNKHTGTWGQASVPRT
jgi:hypothetical protein